MDSGLPCSAHSVLCAGGSASEGEELKLNQSIWLSWLTRFEVGVLCNQSTQSPLIVI